MLTSRGADFCYSNLYRVNFCGANMAGAFFWDTYLVDTNLKIAKGLELCRHGGPSVIDHQTLAKSWPLPIPFLRGCGLPDALIEYLPSLLKTAIEFNSCFISYSTRDQTFAERLYADLQNKGVRCWFAPHDLKGGEKLHEQIDQAIQVHDRLLLILSSESMKSEWVSTEISKARRREIRDSRRVLFPVRLVSWEMLQDWVCFDADTGKDSGREIREYHIPDFSDWKSYDSYQREFDKLLRDLRT